jgi:FlaA1/EpsC-like NDP-sugar epimerase
VPLVLVMFRVQAVVPRSVLLLDPLLLVLIMGGSRFAYRMWREHRLYSLTKAMGEPVLVIGAGETGARLIRELWRSREWRVVGLLDDDAAKLGSLCTTPHPRAHRRAQGLGAALLGPSRRSSRCRPRTTKCARASRTSAPRRRPGADRPVVRRPDQRRVRLGRIRQIELDDLLGRDPVVLDSAGCATGSAAQS